ncbi:MAG: T9SS type A sorting domain-containing protein, partial [Ignavibacteriaceae bacterium]
GGGQINTTTTIENEAATIDSFLCRNIPTGIDQSEGSTDTNPHQSNLFQNYPNPFNPSTTIRFSVPEESFVSIKVYDVLGNEIAILVNERNPAGNYEVDFNSRSLTRQPDGQVHHTLPSGIYFYNLQVYPAQSGADSFIETKKMVLMK